MRIVGTASNMARAYSSVLSNENSSSSVHDPTENPDESDDIPSSSSSCPPNLNGAQMNTCSFAKCSFMMRSMRLFSPADWWGARE